MESVSTPRRVKRWAGIVLFYLIAAFLLTFPTILHIDSQIPLGSELGPTVPYLNVWTQGWNGTALKQGFQGFWDAPIFYPAVGSFAFADPQPITAFISAAFWRQSPALNYNLVLLIYITLNGLAGFRLLRRVEFPTRLALAGGVIIQSLPYLTHERGVIQLTPVFGPLMAYHAVLDLHAHPGFRRSLVLSATLVLSVFSSEYLALASILPLTILVALFCVRRNLPTAAPYLSIAAAGALVITLPFGIAQGKRLQNMAFSRSVSTFTETSAQPADYLRLSPRIRSASLWPDRPQAAGQPLSPGAVLSLAAIPGFILAFRSKHRRRWALFWGITACVMFAASLGSNLGFADWRPLQSLFTHSTVLRWTRSPFRFSLFVQLGCAFLSLELILWLFQRRKTLAFLMILLVLAELTPLPESLVRVPGRAAWPSVLPDHRPLVAAHLPWAASGQVSSFEDTTAWMIESMQVGVEVANGYSGFFPALHRQLRFLLPHFPAGNTLRVLEALGIDIVIDHGELEHERFAQIQKLIDQGMLIEYGRTVDGWVLGLPEASLHSLAEYTGQWSMRTRIVDGRLEVRVHAEVPDDQVFVYIPGLTTVGWELSIRGRSLDDHMAVSPEGSGLVYHGADTWLLMRTGWTLPSGEANLVLRETSTGRVLAQASLANNGE